MIPYLIILFILVLLAIIDRELSKLKLDGAIYFLVACMLCSFAGLRDMIGGGDIELYTVAYSRDYDVSRNIFSFEPGYLAYYKILLMFSENKYFMIFMTSLISLGLQYWTLKRFTNFAFLGLLILFSRFFLQSFIYIRQELAVGIVWLAIPFLLRKHKGFLPYVIVGISFFIHTSALAFLPIIVVNSKKIRTGYVVSFFLAACFLGFTPIGFALLSFMGGVLGTDRVDTYVGTESFSYFYLLEVCVLMALLVTFRSSLYSKGSKEALAFNGFCIYLLIVIATINYNGFSRFNWYYLIFLVICICDMYKDIRDQKLKMLFKTFVITYCIIVYLKFLFTFDDGGLMPYESIL